MLPILLAAATAIALSSDNPPLDSSRTALQEGRYEDAARQIRQLLDADAADLNAWLLFGDVHLQQADTRPTTTQDEWDVAESLYEEAERAYRQAIDLDPNCQVAWRNLGVVLTRTRVEEAVATLYHAHSLSEGDTQTMMLLGQALLLSRQGALERGNLGQAESRLGEAEGVFRKASATLDVQADVMRGMGDVLLARGRNEGALKAYRQAIAIRPTDTGLHDAYLLATETARSFDDSIAFYQGLVDEPALARWYEARNQELKGHVAYNVDHDYDAAADQYVVAEQTILKSGAINPEYRSAAIQNVPLLRSYRGHALMNAGRLEEAEAAFLAALDRDPGLENARKGLQALVDEYWMRMGGEGASAEDFSEICSFAARLCVVNPDDANTWNNYGFFAREAARYEESYQAYRRAVALAPDNARIINDTALILVYHLNRDLDVAEQMLWDANGLAEEERDLAKASEDPARIDATTETYGDTMVNLIVLYDRQGETDQARDMLQRVMEELPDRYEIRRWRKKLMPETIGVDTPPPALRDAPDEGEDAEGAETEAPPASDG